MVNLEQVERPSLYDRLGTNEEFTTILDMKIPAITIPIKPGRNLAIIVEVALANNATSAWATTQPRSLPSSWTPTLSR